MGEGTKFVRTGKVEPWGGVEVTLVMMQPSGVGKVKLTLDLLHWPRSALAMMLVGQGKSSTRVSTSIWSMSKPRLASPARRMFSELGEGWRSQMDWSVFQLPGGTA